MKADAKKTAMASMSHKKEAFSFDTVVTPIKHFCAHHPAQGCHPRAPRDHKSNFNMVFTMMNFKSNDSIASFVLRCQEALHGTPTFEAERELQQQILETRGGRNRRRASSTFKRS